MKRGSASYRFLSRPNKSRCGSAMLTKQRNGTRQRSEETARTDVIDHTETDIRERILITTERLFREVGYQKTTVADIAKTLRMSPANVYRFFDSKRSITAGVVSRQMADVDQALREIAPQPRSATDRLCEMLATMFRMNSERFAGDSKMHEMVAVAMDENWDVCQAHIDRIIAVTADVVADGMRSGEFRPADPTITALCILTSMLRFIHPQMIAQFVDKPSATLEQMLDFVLIALRAPKA
jgi:AcrR family transcriptional regulator